MKKSLHYTITVYVKVSVNFSLWEKPREYSYKVYDNMFEQDITIVLLPAYVQHEF